MQLDAATCLFATGSGASDSCCEAIIIWEEVSATLTWCVLAASETSSSRARNARKTKMAEQALRTMPVDSCQLRGLGQDGQTCMAETKVR